MTRFNQSDCIIVPVGDGVQEGVLADGAEDHDVGHDNDDGCCAVPKDPEPLLVKLAPA